MAASARSIACFALLVSIWALQVPSCLHQQGTSAGTTTTTTAAVTASASASASAPPPLLDDGALKAVAMLALAGMDALLIATAVNSRHTHHAAGAMGAGGGGNGNRRVVTQLAFFVLCLQVGVLQLVLFVQERAAAAGALVISAAAHALPCVASLTFFLGITLVYAHVVSDAGGAARGAVAGNGPAVPAPAAIKLRLLADMTLGAALVCLMSIVLVLALFYVNTKK